MRFLLLFAVFAWVPPLVAAPAHTHGEARLEVVLEGNILTIHLDTPLDGVLGFEHSPRSPDEKKAVQAMKALLESPEHLFQLTPEAGCKAEQAQLKSAVFDGKTSAGHLDLDADYRWQCSHPLALRSLNTRLFAEFPRLKRIKLEFAGPGGQKSGRLSPQQTRFTW